MYKLAYLENSTFMALFLPLHHFLLVNHVPGPVCYGVQAQVTGSGTLTVSLPDGSETTVVAADGDRAVSFRYGQSPCNVMFAFAGDGSAELHDFVLPVKGFVMTVR